MKRGARVPLLITATKVLEKERFCRRFCRSQVKEELLHTKTPWRLRLAALNVRRSGAICFP